MMMTNTMRARVRERALACAMQLRTGATCAPADAAAQIVAAARIFAEYLSGGTLPVDDLDRICVQVEDFLAREPGPVSPRNGCFEDLGINETDEPLSGEREFRVSGRVEGHDESSPGCVNDSRMDDDDGAVSAPSSPPEFRDCATFAPERLSAEFLNTQISKGPLTAFLAFASMLTTENSFQQAEFALRCAIDGRVRIALMQAGAIPLQPELVVTSSPDGDPV